MVDPTHHHRRIHRKARAIHWGLLPLALVVPGAWIYYAVDVCQETVDPFELRVCRWTQAVPLLPAVVGLALAAWILKDLFHLGDRHVGRGYRALDQKHRRHVHWAFAQVALVALGLVAWLVYRIVESTY